MCKTDLHIHTNFSNDGQYTPEEIIDLSTEAFLKEIAITDHNSTGALERAIVYAKNSSVKIISGIEIDCTFEDINIHLLGYHINHKAEIFNKLEKDIYVQEINAFDKKIEKMKKLGLIIDTEKILKHAQNQAPSGELIGEIILENAENRNIPILQPYYKGGSRNDMPLLNFYWDFFSQGQTAYVPISYPTFYEAKEMIENTGGICVIAHPGNNFKNSIEKFNTMINKKLVNGVEVFSNYHTLEQVRYFYEISKKNKLFVTCGSDFHGKIKPLIKLGTFGETKGFEDYFNEKEIF